MNKTRTIDLELWGQPVEVEFEVIGKHRPERAHDYGWDPPETPEIAIYGVFLSHPIKSHKVDLLSVLGDDERETLVAQIEKDLDEK